MQADTMVLKAKNKKEKKQMARNRKWHSNTHFSHVRTYIAIYIPFLRVLVGYLKRDF